MHQRRVQSGIRCGGATHSGSGIRRQICEHRRWACPVAGRGSTHSGLGRCCSRNQHRRRQVRVGNRPQRHSGLVVAGEQRGNVSGGARMVRCLLAHLGAGAVTQSGQHHRRARRVGHSDQVHRRMAMRRSTRQRRPMSTEMADAATCPRHPTRRGGRRHGDSRGGSHRRRAARIPATTAAAKRHRDAQSPPRQQRCVERNVPADHQLRVCSTSTPAPGPAEPTATSAERRGVGCGSSSSQW